MADLGAGASLLLLVGGGVLGSLLDSLLGESVQATYRDRRTGRLTDHAVAADGLPNERVGGFTWMTNDRVNVANTAFGAALGVGAAVLL